MKLLEKIYHYQCLLLLLCAMSTALYAAPSQAVSSETVWKGNAEITFSGTSTLHDWSGTVQAAPFDAKVISDAGGQPVRIRSTVMVTAADMDTAEPKRDENMHKAMQVHTYPLIKGSFDCASSDLNLAKEGPRQLPFTLSLMSKVHQVQGRVSNWKQTPSEVAFDVDFDLSLKACGIKIPAVLFFIRVGDTVSIRTQVVLKKSTSATASVSQPVSSVAPSFTNKKEA